MEEPFAELAARGFWKELALLGRWCRVSRDRGGRVELFAGWPTVEWIRQNRRLIVEQPFAQVTRSSLQDARQLVENGASGHNVSPDSAASVALMLRSLERELYSNKDCAQLFGELVFDGCPKLLFSVSRILRFAAGPQCFMNL